MAEKVDRLTRVNALLKREIASLIERALIVPPGILVSVTEASVSVDLRNATIHVSIFGGQASTRNGLMKQLNDERVEFQSAIGRTLSFKRTPVLEFKLDTRTARGDRVLELLQEDDRIVPTADELPAEEEIDIPLDCEENESDA